MRMIYYFLILLFIFIIFIYICNNKENLSVSQFPIPTCPTQNYTNFYTCGKCQTIYQKDNLINQPCNCGNIYTYNKKEQPSCYKQTLKGGPSVIYQTCNDNSDNIKILKKQPESNNSSSCFNCTNAVGTFDSGSTYLRKLPCPPTPPVLDGMELTSQKQLKHVSELDIYQHLNNGGMVIGAKNGKVVDYIIKKLIENTKDNGNKGYPNFYYIDGPVLIMNKIGNKYYWMVDYPIKYTPSNFSKYVNYSDNWNIAKTIYNNSKLLLDLNSPIFFFNNPKPLQSKLCKLTQSPYSCQTQITPQTNTDYYYPGCSNKSCLWGPDYGSGNWLTRV